MRKTQIALLVLLMMLSIFDTARLAVASGSGKYGPGGCTTNVLYPISLGWAATCNGPGAGTVLVFPTDGNVQYAGNGVDDSNSSYVIIAVGVPDPWNGRPASFLMTLPSFTESCIANLPSAMGTASGILSVGFPASTIVRVGQPAGGATFSTDYAWIRVGFHLVIRTGILAGGSGILDFAVGPDDTGIASAGVLMGTLAPVPPFGTCATPLPLEVHVVIKGGINVMFG